MDISGMIVTVTFHNEENGYSVIKFEPDENVQLPFGVQESFACVGTLPSPSAGERFELGGEWVEHKKFGMQFAFTSARPLLPQTEPAMLKYLASGLVYGVGAATAKNIVNMFGMKSFDVLSGNPEALATVKGISPARAEKICASFAEQQGARNAMIVLQALGVSPSQGLRLYRIYGDESASIIRNNPYQLIDDVDGIGFITADAIARGAGFAADSPMRIRAGLKHTLDLASQKGYTCLQRERVINGAAHSVLQVDPSLAEQALNKLLLDGELIIKDIDGQDMVFLPYLHRHESFVARRLLELMAAQPSMPELDYEQVLADFERHRDIALESQQRAAVLAAIRHNVCVITGGPGTGKTTIVNFILPLLKTAGKNFCLCAPTGRAAKRLSEATGGEASTIHRLLEYGPDGYFTRNADNPLEYDVIIADELSMVDISLMNALMRAVPAGAKLICVGDADQLPSVGPGNVLRDLIGSGIPPVTRLTEIFRQAAMSGIVTNAHRINHGEAPLYDYAQDFQLEPLAPEAILPRLLSLCKEYGENIWNVQVLTPMRQHALGTFALNAALQQELNPPQKRKSETRQAHCVFRDGDKVMHIKNNYQLEWTRRAKNGLTSGQGVFNGDLGTVLRIDTDEHLVQVLFDDERLAVYDFTELKELELAYAMTIHKSQGCEFGTVLLILGDVPPMMRTRNLLYTAVTRAKKHVLILGRPSTVAAMASNSLESDRETALAYFLRSFAPLLGV